jgi:serine/threonine protein phosphatase PrpC
MDFEAYGATDDGRQRNHNEDNLVIDEELGLFAVCDGLGGHAAGEIASEMTVHIVRQVLHEYRNVLQAYIDEPSFINRAKVQTIVELAINTACREVFHRGRREPEKRGMATTIALMLLLGDNAILAHVGDSRIYIWRKNQQHQLTQDHSMLREQLKRGLITKEQAARVGKTAMMSRAIGITEFVEVDTLHLELMSGDVFLICSDGLSDYFRSSEFGQTCQDAAISELPQRLIDFANESGGRDNITAIVVRADPQGTAKDSEVVRKIETLRRIPLFKHLSYQELVKVLAIVRTHTYEGNQRIITEGEEGDELFVSLTGRFEVVKSGQQLTELPKGSFFGEMGLIDRAPRSADIIAKEDSRLMVLQRDRFYELLKAEPQLAVKLLWAFCRVLNERLRNTSEELSFAKSELLSPSLNDSSLAHQLLADDDETTTQIDYEQQSEFL